MDRRKKTICVFTTLIIIACSVISLYMTWNINIYTWKFRLTKLSSLLLIAYAISVSTVLFQTIVNNRLLTPSIMGFDQLYILIKTILMYFVGSLSLPFLNEEGQLILESLILILFSISIFRWLFSGSLKGLHLTLLIGVILGSFFFSLRMFMQLQLNPDQMMNLTDIMFANFNKFNTSLISFATIIIFILSLIGWRSRHLLDILALGRENALNLGINYHKSATAILIFVSILVSISTALVGPVTFFGLLVANLSYELSPQAKHSVVIPIAILLAIICLVGGQFILEQIFHIAGRLSFIIEFCGGIVFLTLLMKGKVK
ncbi:iron chelate uptake ABC transporter family permease subunit [Bartonella krasnovii]|uniref:Iron chelate uptake ABC transporter family permease subunit n=2 Tax=Bartonella krasnovii TaxID=2267275 RepID=A0A5B9D368_9HYPH|nr:iron chelate uptake ABC transporter family permease subunit [Bartonella krasnovii]QEE12601.1 iron chelate uptake ABC transporter family permease subunit [Bartonella krasnovii]UNF28705.1 iron chelate uptake ABC transporter family permease subunit [Bartonella krasnovii]UNF35081.1 iron chelate uptake ABC transporter family permease subunit [Bartonella krasnovii]UNF36711.1 iron chelate uptake ABC transporter family permease subunit [Bartonella krasnovii]UNF38338.1 iron chelate uptake ABC transp